MDADARLAAAAGGVARYIADAAGIENDDLTQFQRATVSACKEAFEYLSPAHPHLAVTVSRFTDRIEVAVAHEGETAPAIGLDTIAGFASQSGDSSAPRILRGVDRVQYETQGASAVTRLTKYLHTGEPTT